MKKNWKRPTLLKRLLIPMIIIMLFQTAILVLTIFIGGTTQKLNQNSLDILNEKVSNRRNYLQNNMLQHWSNLSPTAAKVNEVVEQALAQYQLQTTDLVAGSSVTSELLLELAPLINDLCRQSSVTGAYVMFDGSGAQLNAEGKLLKSSYYVRDPDPMSTPEDNSDLTLQDAPLEVVQKLHITTDTGWTPQYEISDLDASQYAFFTKPLNAARELPEIAASDLGYWGQTYLYQDVNSPLLTYSIPLITADGTAYGVLGIDLSYDYLVKQLPVTELNADKHGSYLLMLDVDQNQEMQDVIHVGAESGRVLNNQDTLNFKKSNQYDNAYLLKQDDDSTSVYASIQYLQLYNTNTPFEDEHWALVGTMEKTYLTGFSDKLTSSILIAALVSLSVGVVSLTCLGIITTRPIMALAKRVKESNPRDPVQLQRTNIQEIDQLSSAIEVLSRDVADSASKLSQIIEMSNSPIGAFEYYNGSDSVYCTSRFFEILGIGISKNGETVVPTDVFQKQMDALRENIIQVNDDETSALFELHEGASVRWVKMNVNINAERTFGIIEDTTTEVLEKQKIEYERDYDLLTSLLNRRAFQSNMLELLSHPEKTKVAALVMLDLDNLKFINDTYGHDRGDEYIRLLAQVLKKCASEHSVVSRMSGDEFFIFFYGEDSKDTIRIYLENLHQTIFSTLFELPNNPQFRLRASAGITWYPDDTTDYSLLIKYADFAMYTVKNTTKGEFCEFNMENYQKNSYLLHNNEELNKLIDGHLVEYHFQPIVSAKTGEVFAYEALMRPTLPTIKSPTEILALAKSQSKLNMIEQITWLESLRAYHLLQHEGASPYLFINSIANQSLTTENVQFIQKNYAHLLSKIVLELTEQEELNENNVRFKQKVIKLWGGMVALDDFGSGYNGDNTLLNVNPDFVKIDMELVRDIDTDHDRLEILRNLIAYCHQRGIRVIAEGVETPAEMETLIQNDVDLLQGYYLARPKIVLQQIPAEVQEKIKKLNADEKA